MLSFEHNVRLKGSSPPCQSDSNISRLKTKRIRCLPSVVAYRTKLSFVLAGHEASEKTGAIATHPLESLHVATSFMIIPGIPELQSTFLLEISSVAEIWNVQIANPAVTFKTAWECGDILAGIERGRTFRGGNHGGTGFWSAPEYLLPQYSSSVDRWSEGVGGGVCGPTALSHLRREKVVSRPTTVRHHGDTC